MVEYVGHDVGRETWIEELVFTPGVDMDDDS